MRRGTKWEPARRMDQFVFSTSGNSSAARWKPWTDHECVHSQNDCPRSLCVPPPLHGPPTDRTQRNRKPQQQVRTRGRTDASLSVCADSERDADKNWRTKKQKHQIRIGTRIWTLPLPHQKLVGLVRRQEKSVSRR